MELKEVTQSLLSYVKREAQPAHTEKLEMVILEPRMRLDAESIKSKLRRREKLYLQLLLNVKEKGKDAGKRAQLTESLSQVCSWLGSEQITNEDLEQILPAREVDRERFGRVFSQPVLARMEVERGYMNTKMERLDRIKKFVIVVRNKFSIPAVQADAKLKEITKRQQ
jgi:hypothetical protein